MIRAAVTWALRCVRACVFVFEMRMYHGCFSMSIFEMESKERSNCHVELCQCELQMQVRQLVCVQGSCDVDGVMCVRACDFVWVYVCVCL